MERGRSVRAAPGALDLVPSRGAAWGPMDVLEAGRLPQDLLPVAGTVSGRGSTAAELARPVAATEAEAPSTSRLGRRTHPGASAGARMWTAPRELLPAARGRTHRESRGRRQGPQAGRPGPGLPHPQALHTTLHRTVDPTARAEGADRCEARPAPPRLAATRPGHRQRLLLAAALLRVLR